MKRECSFCHTELCLESEEKGVSTYGCTNCGTSFFYIGPMLEAWFFIVRCLSAHFEIEWVRKRGTTIVKRTPMKGECAIGSGSIVTALPGWANLTPDNIVSKLPTILVFS